MSTDASVDNKFGVHPDVIKLGLVSLLTDLSSEDDFFRLRDFLYYDCRGIGSPAGYDRGIGDLSASSLNYFSGWLSGPDRKTQSLRFGWLRFLHVGQSYFIDLEFDRWAQYLSRHRAVR